MYCPKCETEVESTVREVVETYPVRGEEITIKARVRFCAVCGEDIWDDKLDSENLLRAYAAYRAGHNLLQPDEIRAIREKYGLSQVAFARVLGLGDKTVARYENGSIADAAQNNLIELMRRPGNFEELLEKNKARITEEDYRTAREALDQLRCRVLYGKKKQVYSFSEKTDMEFSAGKNLYWGDVNYA